jgi:hypothetical protein
MRRLGLAAILLVVLAVAGCGGGKQSSATRPRGLADLHDIGQLRSLFNTRSGEPRLIVLASPT